MSILSSLAAAEIIFLAIIFSASKRANSSRVFHDPNSKNGDRKEHVDREQY